jgi:hypothetical protein
MELYTYSFFVPSWCGQEQLDLAVPSLMLYAAVLSSRRLLFNPRPIRVRFVGAKWHFCIPLSITFHPYTVLIDSSIPDAMKVDSSVQ